ncbi:MAG: hypothetical protein IPM77_10495 [Crocinitomicaceae bacterium]|nr:hypothetical protein [Crocinitomicaceae bacterium]
MKATFTFIYLFLISSNCFLLSDGTTADSYIITSGTLSYSSETTGGKILESGFLDADALKIIRHSKGKEILVVTHYNGPDKIKRVTSFIFEVL